MTDIEKSTTSLLVAIKEFKQQSGFEFNWTKSALLLPNDSTKNVDITSPVHVALTHIPGHSDTYIAAENSNKRVIKKEFLKELSVIWQIVPNDLPYYRHVSVVKMNVLSCFNFLSTMIPLCPPPDYWIKMDKLTNECDFMGPLLPTKLGISGVLRRTWRGT